MTANLALGLRSIAQGGKVPQRQFYRLGAGPVASYKVSPEWMLQLSVGGFTETGLDADGQKSYTSKGSTALFSWERTYDITPRVQAGIGGFLGGNKGQVSAAGPATATAAAITSVNLGVTHGIEAALRVAL